MTILENDGKISGKDDVKNTSDKEIKAEEENKDIHTLNEHDSLEKSESCSDKCDEDALKVEKTEISKDASGSDSINKEEASDILQTECNEVKGLDNRDGSCSENERLNDTNSKKDTSMTIKNNEGSGDVASESKTSGSILCKDQDKQTLNSKEILKSTTDRQQNLSVKDLKNKNCEESVQLNSSGRENRNLFENKKNEDEKSLGIHEIKCTETGLKKIGVEIDEDIKRFKASEEEEKKKNIFSHNPAANITKELCDPNKNIFASTASHSKKEIKPLSFLDKEVVQKKDDVGKKQDEVKKAIFTKHCSLYKFKEGWTKIGPGTIYILKESEPRCVFVRDGINTVILNFFINYDTKSFVKEDGVGFIVYEKIEDKVISSFYMCRFYNDESCKAFHKYIMKK